MNKKMREMQENLERREQALAALNAQLTEANSRIAGYQSRETEVVSVLAEAKTVANRITGEAEQHRESVIAEMAEAKAQQQREAEETKLAAEQQAADIVEGAKAEAKRILGQAEASLEEYKLSAEKLKAEMAEAAAKAQQQAARFSEFLGGVSLPGVGGSEFHNEFTGIANSVEDSPVALPDDYSSPSELMRSIYAIQGREIPEDANETACCEAAPVSEPKIQEIAPETPVQAPEEDHVWTVDEIMNSELAPQVTQEEPAKELGADIDLDSLIDDVLKMD